MNFNPEKIRADFPFFSYHKELVYLDNAASTQKLGSMVNALVACYTQQYAPVHRSIYQLGEDVTQQFEDVRAQVARFIGAHADEIVFTRGTTESINLIALSWAQHKLSEGDEIVLTELEHHANITPWLRLAQHKKVVIRWIPVDAHGQLNYGTLDTIITERTKLVAVTHGSNALGTRVDLPQLITKAKKVGARVLVDAAQTVPHERVDVAALGADFLAFSAHKMLGPTGLGFLYCARAVHKELQPAVVGGGAAYEVVHDRYTLRSMPALLEPGTPAIAEVIAFGAVLTYLEQFDFAGLKLHEARLCQRFIEKLKENSRIVIHGPQQQLMQEGHLVSFSVVGMHAHDVAAYLDTYGICVRAGHHCAQPVHQKLGIASSVRVSFYAYTTEEEVDKVCEALGAL